MQKKITVEEDMVLSLIQDVHETLVDSVLVGSIRGALSARGEGRTDAEVLDRIEQMMNVYNSRFDAGYCGRVDDMIKVATVITI